jgi:ABC-2 type transport system ATP-binding protein
MLNGPGDGGAPAAPEAAIVVDGLRVVRGGRVVLPGLSLAVAAGRVTGLLGPSGCGKSTLMRAVVGVQRVAGGDVRVLGAPAGSPALRDRVGYMTQAPAVYVDLTVTENLRFFARVLDVPRARIGAVIETGSATPTCSSSTSRPWDWTRC